jgi:hypothetical protein
MEVFINDRGNKTHCEPCNKSCNEVGKICLPEWGWTKHNTDQDDSFFGIWTNAIKNEIIVLSGGDFSVIECEGDVAFQNEMDFMYAICGERNPKFNEAGKFEINDLVSYDGRRGTVHNKTLQIDLGWTYQIHFDDQAEWVLEEELSFV